MEGQAGTKSTWQKVETKDSQAAATYMQAAEQHLKRVEVLQGTEWRMTVLCWTLLVVVGGTVAIYPDARTGSLGVAVLGTVVLLATSYAYLFMFSPENYNSLSSERSYWIYMRGRALKASGLVDGFIDTRKGVADSDKAPSGSIALERLAPVKGRGVYSSGIWRFKMAVTAALLLLGLGAMWSLKPLKTKDDLSASRNISESNLSKGAKATLPVAPSSSSPHTGERERAAKAGAT